MEIIRDHLGNVIVTEIEGSLTPGISEDFTSMGEYSRFKFGDGEISRKYGTLLGNLVLNNSAELLDKEQVYVACAAYRHAPPAAASLVNPFIDTAQTAASIAGSETSFIPFKISKKRLATDNYAALSFEERSRTVQNDLQLPTGLDLRNKSLVVMDDIRVTGLREAALENLLSDAGVSQANFFYVLNTHDGRKFPQTEALINTSAVSTIDDVIELANNPQFIPNIRMCKFIAAQTISELERFCSKVPQTVVDTIIDYIDAENLRDVIKYIP